MQTKRMAAAEFIVSFREFFEISAVLGVMLAYLHKSGNGRFANSIWMGAAFAAAASIGAAFALAAFSVEFEEYEALFEGITLIIACAFVSWLIFWMFGQRNVAEGLREGMKQGLQSKGGAGNAAAKQDGRGAGIAMFAFVAVLREGIEIVLFFEGIRIVSGALNAVGAIAGAAAAVLLSYAAYSHLVKLDLGKFFVITGSVLVLMAGGLLGQGVHELEEVGILPATIAHVYDLNPPLNQDGTYPILHEKGLIGSMLKTVVGYDADPSLLQLVAQLGYYATAFYAYKKTAKGR